MEKREIKFRAWDIEEKKMWFNVQNAYDTIESHCEHKEVDYCDCRDKSYPYKFCSFGGVLEDETLIVMQFTRLLDSKGKEIYEGDIIFSQCKNYPDIQSYYKVEWLSGEVEVVDGDNHSSCFINIAGGFVVKTLLGRFSRRLSLKVVAPSNGLDKYIAQQAELPIIQDEENIYLLENDKGVDIEIIGNMYENPELIK